MVLHALPCAFPQLQRLQLGEYTTGAHLALLPAVGDRLPSMRSLQLKHCKDITGVGLSHVARLTALMRLEVAGAVLVVASAFACLSSLTTLQLLGVRCTRLDDDALQHLLRLPELRWLNITGCNVVSSARLVAFLSNGSPAAKDAAAAAMAFRASQPNGAQNIADAGAVPALLTTLAVGRQRRALPSRTQPRPSAASWLAWSCPPSRYPTRCRWLRRCWRMGPSKTASSATLRAGWRTCVRLPSKRTWRWRSMCSTPLRRPRACRRWLRCRGTAALPLRRLPCRRLRAWRAAVARTATISWISAACRS